MTDVDKLIEQAAAAIREEYLCCDRCYSEDLGVAQAQFTGSARVDEGGVHDVHLTHALPSKLLIGCHGCGRSWDSLTQLRQAQDED